MADNLRKNLTGQYAFLADADRAATVKNLHLGGDAVAVTISTNAGAINANLSSTFTATNNAATTFTISNLKNGQEVRLIFTNSHGSNAVTNVFTSMTGLSTSMAAGKIVVYRIFKAGSTTYFTQTALS